MKKYCYLLSTMLLLILVLFTSCTTSKTQPSTKPTDFFPTEEWRTSTPEAQGMDSALLRQMMDEIKTGNHSIDSVLVVRNGYIVWEEYPNYIYDRDTTHILYSATKSFTSALTGIAIDKGYIKSVDQEIMDFFKDTTVANLDERKQRITIKDLLTMTAGFQWDEISYGYSDSRNSVSQAVSSGNYVQYVLDCPMAHEPGEYFTYNTGNTQVLSAIITKATNLNTAIFAEKYLFSPLGIKNVQWLNDAQGIASGGSYLYMTTRDMAKFGYLYLNNGIWDGDQIIPKDWVTKSTTNVISNYGYLWWVNSVFEYYYAAGLYGQRIYVAPESNVVCVITTSSEESSFVDQAFMSYVLGSVSN